MTADQRVQDVLLTTMLGRVFPLWGIVELPNGKLSCECGNRKCGKHAGKHPRWSDWNARATAKLDIILAWVKLFPSANYGVVMGDRVIALDADVRPEEGKYGVAELQDLEFAVGSRIPPTVTVLSGRGNGSLHMFFIAPEPDTLNTCHKAFNAVDLIRRGYCVTPGSRHISGAYYRFEDECNPFEQSVAALPDFLVHALMRKSTVQAPTSVQPAINADLMTIPARLSECGISPGRLRPDGVVRRQIRRDRIAGPLFFEGARRKRRPNGQFDISADDFALACKLAFYCAHQWHQMVRIFTQSTLFGAKTKRWSGGNYLEETLCNAYLNTQANWTHIRKKSSTGQRRGRPLSARTQAVLTLHESQPRLTPIEIANELTIKPSGPNDTISL